MTLWTVARHAPQSMGFFRQEYWSGLPFPPPGGLPDPGMELTFPVSPTLQVNSLLAEPSGKPFCRDLRNKKGSNLLGKRCSR